MPRGIKHSVFVGFIYLFFHHEFVEELCSISGHKLSSQLHNVTATGTRVFP